MKLAFYRGTGILNKAIRFFSRGGYSHIAVILDNGIFIEAYPFAGVRYRKSLMDGMKIGTVVEIFDINTPPLESKIISDFLYLQIDKKYDYWSVFGFILYATEESRRASKRWFCSELLFAAFRKANINFLERVDAWKVSPSLLSYSPLIKYNHTEVSLCSGGSN